MLMSKAGGVNMLICDAAGGKLAFAIHRGIRVHGWSKTSVQVAQRDLLRNIRRMDTEMEHMYQCGRHVMRVDLARNGKPRNNKGGNSKRKNKWEPKPGFFE